MHLTCPHCRNPIEVVKLTPREEVVCPSCGSTIQVEDDGTATWKGLRGQKIDRFELLETVGVGSFGTVYKAHDTQLDRTVALKVPRAGNLIGTREFERFAREARSAAQLRHPSIVTVYQVGQWTPEGAASALPYIVSDFVEGVTLAELLSARRLSFRESAELLAQLAEALQYAHDHGVVHRDVKPSNIMLEASGVVSGGVVSGEEKSRPHHSPFTTHHLPKLMDFGMAKRDAAEITMTVEGQMLGTPAYMSPEQARGEAHQVDGRSDVYSLGVILYEMLTGELPFRGTTRMLIYQVMHEEPRPPRRLNDRIPRDLETICLKCLQKEASKRYPTTRALAADLHFWLDGRPIKARPIGPLEKAWRWCRRNPSVAALSATVALLLVALSAVATVLAIQSERARRQIAGEQAEAERERLDAVAARDHARQILEEVSGEQQQELFAQQRELTPAQRQFLERMVDYYREYGQEAATTEVERRRQARAYTQMSFTLRRLGQIAESVGAQQQASSLFEKLVADFPSSEEYRTNLATSHSNVGNMLRLLGKWDQAEAAIRRALSLEAKVAADFPSVEKHREAIAKSYNNLGALLQELGKADQAEAAYAQAAVILERLANESPTVARYRSDSARIHNNLGLLVVGLGKRERAEAEFRKAVAMRAQLVADFPGVPEYVQVLAVSHNCLGVLLGEMGQHEHAQAELRKGISLQERLVADFPTVPEYRQDLGSSREGLTELLWTTGKHDEARAELDRTIALREKLATDFPNIPRYRLEMAITLSNQAVRLGRLKQWTEAAGALDRAIVLLENLVAEAPNVPQYRVVLARSLSNSGLVLRRLGKLSEAVKSHEKAIGIREKLTASFAQVPQFREDLASSLSNLAWLLVTAPEGEFRDFPKALDLAARGVELAPADADCRATLGTARYRSGDWKGAIADLEKAISLRKLDDSDNASDAFFLAMAYWQHAEKDKARAWFDKAVQWIPKEKKDDADLKRFRAEAAELLGVEKK